MKAWMLDEPGKALALREVPQPQPRRNAVLVRMESVPLLSYTRDYVEGKLGYACPPGPFSPGTNGVGRIVAVEEDTGVEVAVADVADDRRGQAELLDVGLGRGDAVRER